MSKHTPGPWHFVPWHIEEAQPAVRCAEGWIVATTSNDADAEFIARAPAMEARIAELEAENKTRADLNDSYLLDMAQLRAELAAARARLAALEDEKNTYIDYVGDALGQDHDGESLWDAAQRVLSERDKLRAELAAARVDAEDVRAVVNELRGEAHEISGHANWVRIPRYVFGRLCVASGAMKIPSEAIDAARGPA